jgi:hypothetical protein
MATAGLSIRTSSGLRSSREQDEGRRRELTRLLDLECQKLKGLNNGN